MQQNTIRGAFIKFLVSGMVVGAALLFCGIHPAHAAVFMSQISDSTATVNISCGYNCQIFNLGQYTGPTIASGTLQFLGIKSLGKGCEGGSSFQLFESPVADYSTGTLSVMQVVAGTYGSGYRIMQANYGGPTGPLIQGDYISLAIGVHPAICSGAVIATNAEGTMPYYAIGDDPTDVLQVLESPILPPPIPAKEPMIIIPGIMGSGLNASGSGEEIWPNLSKMVASRSDDYLDALKLGSDGQTSQAVYPADILRQATGTFLGIPLSGVFYGNLVNTFLEDGYTEGKDLFVLPYDWRLDIGSQADTLAAKISAARAASPDGKINIIAHSMGGLLVKKYLNGISDSSFVNKLVLVGVPELGSPKDFSVLNYGDDIGFNWFGLFGLNAQETKSISQNMPATYELLPSRKYVGVAGGYVHDFRNGGNQVLNYDQTTALMAIGIGGDPLDHRNSSLLTLADGFHSTLDSQTVNAGNVYNILGCSNPTITGFNLYDGGVVDITRGNGDGTVPALSAMNLANGYTNYFALNDRTAVDHLGLVKDPGPLALIRSIIENASSSGISLPSGFSRSSVDCFSPGSATSQTTLEFSTHSPVDLSVYDAQGRYVGPSVDASSSADTIPGSSYQKIGENTFITVPALGTYKAIEQGTASGTFAMKVKGYSGSSADRVATYAFVPLQSSSTKGELDFSGFDHDMGLKLDSDGNGTTDSVIQPGTILSSPSSTADIIPPEIIMNGAIAQEMQNATATIVFGASDPGSGIAKVMATFNGGPILSGQTIVFAQLGTSTLRITAMDNAGNPAVREVNIFVSPAPVVVVPPPVISVPPVIPTSSVPCASSTPSAPTSSVPTKPALKTISIPISADTYVARQAPNQNRGNAGLLRLQDETWRRESRILLGISSSSLRKAIGTSTIASAKLSLTIAGNRRDWGKAGGKVELYRMTQPWTELGATWNCPNDTRLGNRLSNCNPIWKMDAPSARPWATTSTGSLVFTNTTAGTVTFDVTGDIKAFFAGSLTNNGWILKKAQENLSGSVNFYSRESIHRPTLTVTYQ